MQTIDLKKETTIQQRIKALLITVLEDNALIPAAFHKVVLNQVDFYLNKTNPQELIDQIKKIRDEIIPFILGEA